MVDLESILSKGILSLNESGNNNWDDGKRANNSSNVVYLFKPLKKQNSFCQYGAALVEVCVPDENVKENALSDNDVNKGKYVEYVMEKVNAELISAIYIPVIFKSALDLSKETESRITWCGMKANYYGNGGREECPVEVLEQFAKTAEIMDSGEFNFFRGKNEKREMIDLYDVRYIF